MWEETDFVGAVGKEDICLWCGMGYLSMDTWAANVTRGSYEHLETGQNAWRKGMHLSVNWITENFQAVVQGREIWALRVFCSNNCWDQNIAGRNELENSTKNIIMLLQGSIIGSSLEYLAHFLSFYIRKGYDNNKRGSQTEKMCY